MRLIKTILAFFLSLRNRFRSWLLAKMVSLRAKKQIGSLRPAIIKADKNKAANGRKNIVVFNSTSGEFEPVEKKSLKAASRATRNRSNKAMTEGRKRMMKKAKPRVFDPQRVKQIEEKSLYVTQ